MSSKRFPKGKLITDKSTDYLFDYFMHEDKFNEQMRGEWDEQMEKKMENHHNPRLDSRVTTEKKDVKAFSSSSEKELPSNQEESESTDVDFDESSDRSETASSSESVQHPVKSPYGPKIEARPDIKPRSESKSRQQEASLAGNRRQSLAPTGVASERPLLGEKLVENIQQYVETPEERRARAREEYSKLQDLVERYNVKLTRDFTINDDPDEMRAEYDMHKERRHKNNQVKFYKQILLNIVCGVEFLNDKYDPFAFKLKDWSKQVAGDLDDYTEVLEEIYEKYKNRGGNFPPEIRLLFMIIMSGVSFHLSNTLFGSDGLNSTIKNNPNIINKLLSGLMQGKSDMKQPAEETPKNNKDILEAIRKHNQGKHTENKSETPAQSEAKKDEALALERERRLLAEQKAQYENQMRKQNEMYMAQLEQLKNQQQQIPPQNIPVTKPVSSASFSTSFNQVLSDAGRRPRFLEHQSVIGKPTKEKMKESDDLDIFESEIKDTAKNKKSSSVRKQDLDELIESLEESTDVDIDEIIETSSKKRANSKPITSSRKPKNNSATRSATRSATKKRNSDVLTEGSSASKKNNVIHL